MDFARWSGICLILSFSAAPTWAGYTPAEDHYQLQLGKSHETYLADSLCIAGNTLYFRKLPADSLISLDLRRLRSLERDPYHERWLGAAIGGGIVLGGILGNYFLGGGNHPGAFMDRRGLHVLAGIFFVPLGALTGSAIGEISGRRVLYDSRRPLLHQADRDRQACGSDTGKRYRDLNPELEKQDMADSILLAGSRKNRFDLMSGALSILSMEGKVRPEFIHLSYTRFFFAHKDWVYGAKAGFSRTAKIGEAGSRYLADLMGSAESPLSPHLARIGEFGFRFVSTDPSSDEFPLLDMGGNLGLSWQTGAWRVLAEASLFFSDEGSPFYPSMIGARVGVGFAL